MQLNYQNILGGSTGLKFGEIFLSSASPQRSNIAESNGIYNCYKFFIIFPSSRMRFYDGIKGMNAKVRN